MVRGEASDVISWTVAPGAASYNVYAQAATARNSAKVDGTLVCGHVTATSCENAHNGGAYDYVVTGVDGDGNESDSSSAAVDATPPDIMGCTDYHAENYDPSATVYGPPGICQYSGCADPAALNYDYHNIVNDGSCVYPPPTVTSAQYTVTPSALLGAVSNPNTAQPVASGSTISFVVSGFPGQIVGGTCPAGDWTVPINQMFGEGTYTTGPITADCTVIFTAT
ncbi:MAG: hypothetical protein HZB29_05715 [Nitrospinae bacterium]|nr:hypothetical protein [Nitrospinota bacterium]